LPDYELVYAGHRFTSSNILHNLFLGFNEADADILTRLTDPNAKAEPGFLVDVFGIRTRTANLWPEMHCHDGGFWGLPVPGNWHWETPEWVGLIRSVLSAGDRYRIMELGAGWGPAAVGGGVLARLKGISDIHVTAVEADPHHFRFLTQHVADNGLAPANYTLLEAAVGVRSGSALWPDSPDSATAFGNRPITREGDYLGRTFEKTRKVKILAFTKLLRKEPLWDMVHMDIQGTEVAVCRAAIQDLNRRVARVCIGTHSRKIDGDLFELFAKHGWVMENERPSRTTFVANAKTLEAMNIGDGIQIWRNPKLRGELN
jgi:FkbM family methyltransferase